MHRDLEGGPSIVCRGRALVAALFAKEKQARHSCQAALLAYPSDRPLSAARLRGGTQERWYFRLWQNADWMLITTGLALFSAAGREWQGARFSLQIKYWMFGSSCSLLPDLFGSGKRDG